MNIDKLILDICTHLRVLAPEITDPNLIINECLTDARKFFKDDFICMISPAAWAKITLIYHKHFLDSGKDISTAEIITAVIRDSISTNRMDMVTLSLVQQKSELQESENKSPSLKIVKD